MRKEMEPEVEPDQGDNDDFSGKSMEKQFVGKVPGMKNRRTTPRKRMSKKVVGAGKQV